MSFIRKYWIAGLVILLVAIHAVIIGYVRSEAMRLKTVASSEIPLGLFYKQSSDRYWLTQLRVHVQVPAERRLAARATIEHNHWLVHQAVEETIRRLDENLLLDPSLVTIKEEIRRAVNEALHEALVERVVINDRVDLETREFHLRPSQELIAPGEENRSPKSSTLTSVRPVRPPLSEQTEVSGESDEDGHDGGDEPAEAHGDSHESASHAEKASHHKPAGHAAPKKSKAGHH